MPVWIRLYPKPFSFKRHPLLTVCDLFYTRALAVWRPKLRSTSITATLAGRQHPFRRRWPMCHNLFRPTRALKCRLDRSPSLRVLEVIIVGVCHTAAGTILVHRSGSLSTGEAPVGPHGRWFSSGITMACGRLCTPLNLVLLSPSRLIACIAGFATLLVR